MKKITVTVKPPFIKLDALLKFSGAAQTGGQAKELIAEEKISVNGAPCTQRGKKIQGGDVVLTEDLEITVAFE